MSPELRADLERLAAGIVDRGLAVPAVFFLELHRPLAYLGSQALVVASPMLLPLLGLERFERWREVLADDDQYNTLLNLIEQQARAASTAKGA